MAMILYRSGTAPRLYVGTTFFSRVKWKYMWSYLLFEKPLFWFDFEIVNVVGLRNNNKKTAPYHESKFKYLENKLIFW